MTDLSIREQSYRYFLQEAPDLLQIIEQDLLGLRADYSINKIHNLMRTTHTIKGAAASVGLETIKTVAHSLEDIFKAFFNPDLLIDAEVEALLFEGYECLCLPISAELTGGQVNDVEILDRAATVFARLQEKLGDCFGSESHIPSSVELGFDVTQSIFEVGVTQRINEIAAVIKSENPEVVAMTLQTQADVFLGLAESLNLPGFGAIAQAAIAALEAHPDQVLLIAQTALADFQAGQTAVLEGDRTQGGQPSQRLQQLSGLRTCLTEFRQTLQERRKAEEGEIGRTRLPSLENSDISIPSLPNLPDSDAELSWVSRTNNSQNEESVNPLLELIWGGELIIESQPSEQESLVSEDSLSETPSHQEKISLTDSQRHVPSESVSAQASLQDTTDDPASLSRSEVRDYSDDTSSFSSETSNPTSIPQKRVSPSRTVRVNVEHLDHLNYSIGELLTNHNRQSLQNEQLEAAVRSLLARLKQHQHLLDQLQDWSDRLFVLPEQQRNGEWGMGKVPSHPLYGFHNPLLKRRVRGISPKELVQSKIQNQFDSLELDRYSDSSYLIQLILEDAVQLAEAAEAIDLFTNQSHQTLEKQRRLLTGTRDAVMEARMLPLGEIFDRFPRVLQQLESMHDKPVALQLRGSEVLVDKVVAEKLYSPLLHLVRNAFAHGIEPPTVRQQQGKPKIGQIEIFAYHRGKFLVIEVRDDGQGLDFATIRQRAVERQLVTPEAASCLNEAELTNLLFEAGFSTASKVSDLSGRGIGLDMVRAQLQSLQGSVAVSSQRYRGTTFVLQIPLSLTIAKLLICQAGNGIYALLTDAIVSIVIPQAHQIRAWDGGKVIRWGKGTEEQLIPVHRLSEVLNYFSLLPKPMLSPAKPPIASEGSEGTPIILIRCQERLLGLEIDQLMGEQELVIRPLGETITPPAYVYGGSILADGRLTLVIDGAILMQYVSDCAKGDRHTKNNNVSLPFGEQDTYTIHSLPGSTPHTFSSPHQHKPLLGQTRAALPAAPEPDVRARLGKVVLVVDDSITLRQTLVLTLQRAGYQVLQAKDGYEAIEQLRHQPHIQLVICDIEMPRMNGFEFLKYRQQDPALANIPTVILTSRSGEKHRLIATELGATEYITKPFLEHNLLATVSNVLKKNRLNLI